MGDCRAMAYESFVLSYRTAFAHIWPKIKMADVKTVLQSVKDKELNELRRMSQMMSSDSSKLALSKENRAVPALENILGSMVNRLPDQKLLDKDTCTLISTIFSDLAEAHKHYSSAACGIADIATLIPPEQLTLVLAAAVPPTLQLVLPPGVVSPLSAPPPPPKPATTMVGRLEKYCKTKILPTSTDEAFLKCEERSPIQVLAVAIFCTLEKHLFDETTTRADIANTFHITSTQLHKAMTGVDYQSGPHVYVVPPQSWGDRSDTKHSKCLLLGGRRLNQLTLIPKLKGSGSARAATAQVGPANNRNDTKRCLPVEASLRPGEAVPW